MRCKCKTSKSSPKFKPPEMSPTVRWWPRRRESIVSHCEQVEDEFDDFQLDVHDGRMTGAQLKHRSTYSFKAAFLDTTGTDNDTSVPFIPPSPSSRGRQESTISHSGATGSPSAYNPSLNKQHFKKIQF